MLSIDFVDLALSIINEVDNEFIEKLDEIEEAGGKKVQDKTKISDEHGFYSVFKDSCDNLMGLWSRN